ncbi:restriction endonuclease subunit S [Citrobacter braakii]|uniref:restriction endonuclease subunit S n=1 Tax=Citrobacter braakii TaxID=57706 RepID=UPI0040391A67
MSKLTRLIAQYCPNGVEFKTLGSLEDAGVIKLGRGNVISKNDLSNSPGNYPVYSSSAAGNGEFGRYGKFMFEDERISWSIDGGGRFFYRHAHKYSVTNVCGWLKVEDLNILSTRFLYHVLSGAWETKFFNYTKKAHPSVIREEYSVPLPPIEVQQEIVRILDAFTSLTAELTAELTARKKQYNYYRDQLLGFEEGEVEWKALGEIGEFIRGKRFTKADYVEDGISVIHYGEIYTRYGVWTSHALSKVRFDMADSLRYAKPGDVIMASVGETVDDVGKAVAWIGNEKVAIHDDSYAFRHSMNPKFISYVMQTAAFIDEKAKHVSRGKVNRLLINGIEKVRIPIPYPDDAEKSLAEQARIVAILDKFDALTNSISEGLPREIALRQKQYEYYRDLLLSFPKPEEVVA